VTWDRVREARKRLEGEQGAVVRDWGGQLPVALVYPNSYFLGMSNLGLHAIYSLLNSLPNVVCERVFWEKPDKGTPAGAVSIESQRSLPEFAIVAFSVTYELDYFNIPRILESAGIPLFSSQRDESHPLIIAGGACVTANPMPVLPFFDAVCIGEAEAILQRLMEEYTGVDSGDREGQLTALSRVPGVYVPVLEPGRVVRQWAKELDDFPVHSVVLTRDTELGDMYLIEVERGCRWRCRFCLVCSVFRPMRVRSVESIEEQGRVGLRYRRRLGLVGADVPDHPEFDELLTRLKALGADISVSSLRMRPVSELALSELARGTGTVAFAPEAGSERLRQVIRKGITEEDILRAIDIAARYPVKQIRLYFMIGLPTETDDDVDAIAVLSSKCKSLLESRKSAARIVLSVSPFVPKAGTPFQRMAMEGLPVLNRRLARLKARLSPQGIKVVGESPAWSEVQAALARGDSSLAAVLVQTRETTLPAWRESVRREHIEAVEYAHGYWAPERKLPWQVVSPEPGQDLADASDGFALDGPPIG
jgi:radical SAM superfamily enzyme YgiQ (UPF0313 family)